MMKNSTNLVTKEYLDKKLDQVNKKFDQVDKKFDQVNEKFDQVNEKFDQVNERIEKVEDSIIDLKDSVMGELKSMREDNDARLYLHQTTTDSFDDVNDTLGDHERRLKKLEKPTL